MVSFHDLTSAIDADRGAMRGLLSALVAIPTENPPATGYLPCVALLESTLTALEFPHERIDIASPAEAPRAVVRAWLGDAGPALCFHGHYDVVPAMSAEQFVPRIEGDTVFGRGSSDMKSGLVAMLFAAKALRTAGVALRGRLDLVFVPDEETGGAYGSAALAASGHLGADCIGMLLPEPTSGVVWNANRGAITLEVCVRGRAAHVALQHQGINAVERALPLLMQLVDFKRELEIRFYAERGVPALAYGPSILAVSHGPREFVKLSRMVDCAKIYALTAVRMLGAHLSGP